MLVVNKCVAHPWQCDVMGHLTTRFYLEMFDDASYHFLYTVFGWTISAHESQKYGWADVRHVIEYKAEVSAGDVLEIRATLQKIGTKSFTVLFEMVDLVKSEISATLESVCVFFDLEARRSIPLTDEMTKRAQRYLEK